jgi:hypothetical protein
VSRGRLARLPLLLAAVALATLAAGAPRFTWANDGVRVDHPRTQAAFALAAALAMVGAAWAVRGRWPRVAAGLGAVVLAGLAAQRLAWRIEAVAAGIHLRSLAGTARLAWREVAAVEPRAGSLTLRAADGRTLVIATHRFAPDERVRLERTIARRVLEASR